MSDMHVEKFFGAIGKDASLRQRAESAMGTTFLDLMKMNLAKAEGGPVNHVAQLVTFASKEGYPFTRDGLVAAVQAEMAQAKAKARTRGELSDKDLEAVAGGGTEGVVVGAVAGGIIGGVAASPGTPAATAIGAAGGAAAGAFVGDAVQEFVPAIFSGW